MSELLTNRRLVLAGLEGVYGAGMALTPAANLMLARDVTVTPIEANQIERKLARPYLGAVQRIPGSFYATVDISVELCASGTPGLPPKWGVLQVMSGFEEIVTAATSVRYLPVSKNFASGVIWVNYDGILHKLVGARGTPSYTAKIDDIAEAKFSLTGLFAPATDSALPDSIDDSGWPVPVPVLSGVSSTLQLHGTSGLRFNSLSIDIKHDVKYRAASNSVRIGARDASLALTIDAHSIATKDWSAAIRQATRDAFEITLGSGAGNLVKLSGPKVSLGSMSYADDGGVQTTSLDGTLNPDAGDDEFEILLT